jgi:hypothetical protein
MWSYLSRKPQEVKKTQPERVTKPEAQRVRELKKKPKKTVQFPKDPAKMVQVIDNRAQAGALPPQSNPTLGESSVPAQGKEKHPPKVSPPMGKATLKANGESSSKMSRRPRQEVGPGTPGSITVAVAVAVTSSNVSSFSTTTTRMSTRIPKLIVEWVQNLRAPDVWECICYVCGPGTQPASIKVTVTTIDIAGQSKTTNRSSTEIPQLIADWAHATSPRCPEPLELAPQMLSGAPSPKDLTATRSRPDQSSRATQTDGPRRLRRPEALCPPEFGMPSSHRPYPAASGPIRHPDSPHVVYDPWTNCCTFLPLDPCRPPRPRCSQDPAFFGTTVPPRGINPFEKTFTPLGPSGPLRPRRFHDPELFDTAPMPAHRISPFEEMPRSTSAPDPSHPSDLDTKILMLKEVVSYVDDELAREKHRDKKGKGGEKTPAAAATTAPARSWCRLFTKTHVVVFVDLEA